jgi:hypothetical protein
MKLAVLTESPADEAAIRILVDGLLGIATEVIDLNQFQARSTWPGILTVLPKVLRHVHHQTDADCLAVSVDSDRSPLHQANHEQPGAADPRCRLCLLRQAVEQTQQHLGKRHDGSTVRVAIALAVPEIEAWYLFRHPRDPNVGEAGWLTGVQSGRPPYTKQLLKQTLYGTAHPSLVLEMQHATQEAHRLVTILHDLTIWFPSGFGSFAQTVRAWQQNP